MGSILSNFYVVMIEIAAERNEETLQGETWLYFLPVDFNHRFIE